MHRPSVNAALAAAFLGLLACSGARGAVWFVDASAPEGGDGTSWASAYRFLQDGLLNPALAPGDEIRVAQGAYRPDRDALHPGGTQNPESTFELRDGVSIFGGFPTGGGDGTFAARDPDLYPTVLDGDIFEPPGKAWPSCVEPGPVTGNCFEMTPGTAGCTDGACCSAVCEFLPLCCLAEWNEPCAEVAGSLCHRVYNVVYAFGVTGARLDGFTICNSRAVGLSFWDQSGGGLLTRYCSPVVTRCTFTRNIAVHGGAVFAYGNTADPRLTNCVLRDNDAVEGGAVYAAYGGPVIINCLLEGNTATGKGGAFFGFASNGAAYISTLAGNNAADDGGGTFGLQTMLNCIAWDNVPNQVVGASLVSYSCVQGGHAGTGNFGADPAFADAAGGDYHVLPGSPCIDHGGNALLPGDIADIDGDLVYGEPTPLDLDLKVRIFNATVDVGAYESCQSDADLNGDGAVNIVDLFLLFLAWASAPGGPPDLDGDGTVGVTDLLLLLTAWGSCTPP